MERNNDGKKSCGSRNAGIVPDTRVLWHRLSPATHYRGRRSRSDSWLADTDRPSYIYIPTEKCETVPIGGKACWLSQGARSHRSRKGADVQHQQHLGFGMQCHHHCALPATRDGSAGGLPLWGCKSPSRGGLRGRDTGKVHPDSYRREAAALTLLISCAIHRERSLHQVGLAKK